MTPESKTSVLFVDDDLTLLKAFEQLAVETGEFTVTAVPNPLEALEISSEKEFDVIVSDYSMPEKNGIDFLKFFRVKHPKIPFILFTGVLKEEVVAAIGDNKLYYLSKGGDFGRLIYLIKEVVAPGKEAELSSAVLEKQGLLNQTTLHDWRNNDTTLAGYLGLIEGCVEKARDLQSLKKEIEGYLPKIQKVIERNKLLRDESKTYHEINSSHSEWIIFEGIVSELKERHSKEDDPALINKIPADIEIFIDKNLFLSIAEVLIDNSKRHGQRTTEARLSFRKDEDTVKIVYEDNGVGVVPENKEKIFRRGFGGNTGMGLFLAKELISLSGGMIVETGSFGQGVSFEIGIPFWRYRRGPENY